MKSRLFILALLVAVSSPAAFFEIGIFADPNGAVATAEILPGDSLNLWTRVSTDLEVAGISYNIVFPDEQWILGFRDYATHGWISEDGNAAIPDFSWPQPSAIGGGLTITSDLFDETFDPDFHFESTRPCGIPCLTDDGFVTDDFIVEEFNVAIPSHYATGIAEITITDLIAFDKTGQHFLIPFALNDPVTSQVGSFGVNVVPEPSTVILYFLTMFGVAAGARMRPRRSSTV